VEDYSQRSASSLGFTWTKGVKNGGSEVLDFTVSIAQG
jgi:hypothetical protein